MSNTSTSEPVVIYTDGACQGNPGPGGWGAIIQKGGKRKEINGGTAGETTNNRMELLAAIKALQALRRPLDVIVFTDSRYLCQGASKWLPDWKARGWLTSNKRPVENRDLWEELDRLCEVHRIDWQWVRGHTGNRENERADRLAHQGMFRALGSA